MVFQTGRSTWFFLPFGVKNRGEGRIVGVLVSPGVVGPIPLRVVDHIRVIQSIPLRIIDQIIVSIVTSGTPAAAPAHVVGVGGSGSEDHGKADLKRNQNPKPKNHTLTLE